jgi:hypothetical protein
MQKFLFKNFLTNARVYGLNQAYWKKRILAHLPLDEVRQYPLYQTTFANGTKMLDGNPIYSFLLKNGKSVRIIQEEPESDTPQITAWLSETESLEGNKIEELVITLELSDITYPIALQLISIWSQKGLTSSEIRRLVEQKSLLT